MPEKSSVAGRRGPDARSDCFVSIQLHGQGSIELDIQSKVGKLYGDQLRSLILEMVQFYGLSSVTVRLEDNGALPYTLRARLECAIRRLGAEFDRPYPAPETVVATYPVSRERFRRSRLYLPGNEPKFIINAGIHQPDGIILDLEDSVAPSEKDAARILVRNALAEVDFYGVEKMVRINQIPQGLDDLDEIIPFRPHTILVPKCEHPNQLHQVEDRIRRVQETHGQSDVVFLMPIIESAAGILRAHDIATASPNVVALTIGLEDFTADIGAERTDQGNESFMARSMIVLAARAAGIQPIDTVYSDVQNEEGLRRSTLESKSLGFEGRGCIHPRQIQPIHESFAPKDFEVEKALRIIGALEKAKAEGSGVVSLGSKMIDPPVVKRAERIVRMARQLGMLKDTPTSV